MVKRLDVHNMGVQSSSGPLGDRRAIVNFSSDGVN